MDKANICVFFVFSPPFSEPVEIPVENLRRSTRATRGVQRFEVSLASSPRRKRNEKEIQVEVW